MAFRDMPRGHAFSMDNRTSNMRERRPQPKFSQAMTEFKGMFPDMDAKVIEAILRSNKGSYHVTLNQLCTRSAENEYDKLLHDPADVATTNEGKEKHHPDFPDNPASGLSTSN